MHALNSHLRVTGDHGHLPFHSGCPTCRAERLQGPLPARGIISRRIQAAAVAAALAVVPAAAPVRALAAGFDDQQVGSQDPGSVHSDDPADDPKLQATQGPRTADQDLGPAADPDAPSNEGEPDPLDGDTTPPPQAEALLAAPSPPAAPAPTPAPPASAPLAPPPIAPPALVQPSDEPSQQTKSTDGAKPKHAAKPKGKRTRPGPPRGGVAPSPVVGAKETPLRGPNRDRSLPPLLLTPPHRLPPISPRHRMSASTL
jgi:hypothetical protein